MIGRGAGKRDSVHTYLATDSLNYVIAGCLETGNLCELFFLNSTAIGLTCDSSTWN